MFLGDSTQQGAAQGLVNIAGLLGQTMTESAGYSACDENNWRNWPTAACSQRADHAPYAGLNDRPYACKVKKEMYMKAYTFIAPGPLKCVPGTITEACCWWGRGAIQTTGPNNYGLL